MTKRVVSACVLAILLLALTVTARAQDTADARKGQVTFGLGGFGAYEISNYESLYVNFPTNNINTGGAGFQSYVEYGLSDKFTFSGTLGYSRLLYADKFKTQVKENFFLLDALGSYYFTDPSGVIQPYLAGGAGAIISGSSAAPVLDLGGGIHFKVAENVSIRAQVLYKTAIIHNRGEGSIGIAYHF